MLNQSVKVKTAECSDLKSNSRSVLNKQNHLLVSDLTEIRTTKMTQWTKKILRRKGGKGTVTNAEDEKDVKATKLMEFIEVTDPKDAV